MIVCLGAALATALMAKYAYPEGSGNLDEAAYEAQASALAHGDLTLPAATHDPSFRPFLTGVRDDRVVFKYQPVWPALLATSERLTGSSIPVRVALSAGAALAVMWFAWELTRARAVSVLAGIVFVASPFTWVQSASLLGYQLSLVLGAVASAAFLAAGREQRARFALLAGASFGLAVFHRPFDAIILVGPVAAYAAGRAWHNGRLVRLLGAVALGGAPFALLFVAYNQHIMGSPFTMAYSATGGLDRFGFGYRSSFALPGGGRGGQVHYTVGVAFETLRHFFFVLPRFVAFAPVVLGCIVVLFRRHPRDPRAWLLFAMFATNIVGYFFWWGNANTFHFRLEYGLGPFYGYPLLIPLAVAGAWGATEIRSDTWRAAAVVLGVVWAGWFSVAVARDAANAGTGQEDAVAPYAGNERRLVLAPPSFPNDPYLHVANDAHLGGRRLVAIDIPGRRIAVIDAFPDRAAFGVRPVEGETESGRTRYDRVPLTVERGPAITLRARAEPPGTVGTLYIKVGDGPEQQLARGTGTLDATFVLDPAALPPTGAAVPVTVGVGYGGTGTTAPTELRSIWDECRFEARRFASGPTATGPAENGTVEVLVPCEAWQGETVDGAPYVTPLPSNERLRVTVAPAP